MRLHGAHGCPWLKVVVGPLLLVALGCGDRCCGPGPEPPDVLALDEAVQLFAGSYFARYPVRLEAGTVMTVVACPTAGQVRVTGRVSETSMGDTLRWEEDITLAPAGCQFSEGNNQFTVDGRPGVRSHIVSLASPEILPRSIEGTVTGGLGWELEDRSGFCAIELEITQEVSGTEWSEGLSGTLCGHAWEFAVGPGS